MGVGEPRAGSQERFWWPGRPDGDVVLEGLALNPAIPVDLLLALLRAHSGPAADGLRRRRELPPPVVGAMLHHREPWVRAALGVNPWVGAQVRLRLVDDPDGLVRSRVSAQRDLPVPDHVLGRGLDRLDRQVERGLMGLEELRGELREELLRDRRLVPVAVRHPRARIRMVVSSWPDLLDGAAREALLHDEAPQVRAAAVEHLARHGRPRVPGDLPHGPGYERRGVLSAPLSRALVDEVVAVGGDGDLSVVAANPTTPADVVAALLHHRSAQVRRHLATRDDLTGGQLAHLAADPDVSVRTAVSVHPGLTEAQRAGIDIDVRLASGDGHVGTCVCQDPPVRVGESAESARWARSVNPLLRRRAARDPRLPGDLVGRLAEDPDPGVRAVLALHHPAAPPALLLRVFLEFRGCGRGELPGRAGFPTGGLARFADDPDPAVRRLVALDPAADPVLVGGLLADPDAPVRQAAPGCPRLPVPRIVALLDDSGLAGAAAANPALPVAVMGRLIAGPPPRRRVP